MASNERKREFNGAKRKLSLSLSNHFPQESNQIKACIVLTNYRSGLIAAEILPPADESGLCVQTHFGAFRARSGSESRRETETEMNSDESVSQ